MRFRLALELKNDDEDEDDTVLGDILTVVRQRLDYWGYTDDPGTFLRAVNYEPSTTLVEAEAKVGP